MFAIALLLPIPELPVIPAASLPVEAQWKAVAACPVIRTARGHGSGVVIGKKDEFVFVLTAAHVAPFDLAGVEFYTQDSWPGMGWRADEARVVQRWGGEIDLALLRCKVSREPGILPLAAPGQRPKTFPAPALSVGAAGGIFPTIEADTILAKQSVRPRENSPDIAFYWRMQQRSRKGRSGGPLLDIEGKVIGICIATDDRSGFYVHLDEIQAALKRDHGEYSWLVPPKRD